MSDPSIAKEMNFWFSPEEESFRQEVRTFYQQELPASWWGGWLGSEDEWSDDWWEFSQQLRRKLGARGWLALGWPEQYGGTPATPATRFIFEEETEYFMAPGVDMFGIKMVGPTLLRYGNEEQRRRFLPEIARGEKVWCEGLSEPGHGSDLAAVETRAREDGDDFVINGSKIWTTGAHRANWMFMLARTTDTEPKHRGLSFFLLDMKSPGVTVRPVPNMLNLHSFNQVFFDNVRVPRSQLVGERDKGWYAMMNLLDGERSRLSYFALAQRILDELVLYVRERQRAGDSLAQTDLVRHKLAELQVEAHVCKALAYRILWLETTRREINAEASVLKLFGTELQQRLSNTGLQLLGLYGQLEREDPRVRLRGWLESLYLASLSFTILAGTNEVQRSIIANRGLDLPR